MNARQQARVLYREFLFRIVDRELLSAYATGDASQLLLQILTLLVCLSVLVSVPALVVDPGPKAQVRVLYAWSAEHFLIATTMLAVGILALLGWGSTFPDQRDMRVLAPLPVRAHTILIAKLGALGTALGATVLALHSVAGVVWPLALGTSPRPFTIPALTSEPALPPVGAGELQAVLDEDFAPAVRDGALAPGRGAGLSIGVSTRGTRRVFAYGAATMDSVFHIASVSKVFTGVALAHLIEQGRLRIDTPVRELIPDAGLGRPAGSGEITLRDLVTHESGLPPMPVGFRPSDPENPYAEFDVNRLYHFLGARGVARPRSVVFRYSNLGFGLLGHALATHAGVDYGSLVRQRITMPLGMTDTGVVLPADQQRRLIQGYDREHRAVPRWDVPEGLAGAGALMSTAPDLLTWLEANLHPERLPPGVLRNAIRASQQRLTGEERAAGMAFGWFVGPSGEFVHAGDTAGLSALLSFNPSQDSAFVVLANTQRGTSVSADVVGEHIRARLAGAPPIAIADLTIPGQRGVGGWLRRTVAYWATMLAAGVFMFGLTVSLQGLAAALVPHRHVLRVSSVLQLAVFGLLVGGYVLQPMVVSGSTMVDAQRAGLFAASPSYWFLGLFQAINGSPALSTLAGRAVGGLATVTITAVGVCAWSHTRTLKRLAEEPDIAPVVQHARRLPPVGPALHTAIVHFSARTLFRSAQHRVIFAFYLGIGVALSAVFLKSPRAQAFAEEAGATAWDDTSMAVIVSSIVMMACAVVGARVTFAMPRDLAANWVFRILPMRGGSRFLSARRRALIVLAAGPVWVLSAGVLLVGWPWWPAIGHLIILALVGAILVELSLAGARAIPFTCAYLPGTSRAHVSVPVTIVILLVLAMVVADWERRALEDGGRYATLVAALAIAWIGARWHASWLAEGVAPEFDDEPADRALSLGVWDFRVPKQPNRPPHAG